MDPAHPLSYQAPDGVAAGGRGGGVSLATIVGQLAIAAVVIIGSVVFCAVAGGLIGKAIAVLCPTYYPSVFATAASQPGFNANDVGIGLGIGEGAIAGLVVGLVLVLALAIANRRRSSARI